VTPHFSAAFLGIAEALVSGDRGVVHLIIDAFQEQFHDAGWNAIVAAGLTDVCSLVRERSQLALPRLVADGLIADAAFVDGSHLFHNVFVDLFFLGELVRPGGLVILDDYRWPSVATAVGYFESNTGWQVEPIGHQTRLRAYRVPNPSVEPSFGLANRKTRTSAEQIKRTRGDRPPVSSSQKGLGSPDRRRDARPLLRRPLSALGRARRPETGTPN
jgi:Methyltransferase domain